MRVVARFQRAAKKGQSPMHKHFSNWPRQVTWPRLEFTWERITHSVETGRIMMVTFAKSLSTLEALESLDQETDMS